MKNGIILLLLCCFTLAQGQVNSIRDMRRSLISYDFTSKDRASVVRSENFEPDSGKPGVANKPVWLELSPEAISFPGDAPFFSFSLAWNEQPGLSQNSRFFISFSTDSLQWGNWEELEADAHVEDIQATAASGLVFCGPTMRYFRLRIQSNLAGKGQVVKNMVLNAFSPGPRVALRADGGEKVGFSEACSCPQPAFISRKGWSCPQGTTSPGYTTVTHLIVHHAAGTNVSNDWAGVVLAIWNLHVYTNGWADVGYNWLIAPDGTLFEGRGGGDNVTGAHFCGKNSGTMGICMLGTYTSTELPEAAKTKLIATLAWKACQRSIDPTQVSYHNSTQSFLNTISGHRDGCSTECPGDQVYKLLPLIRQAALDFGIACASLSEVGDEIPGLSNCQFYPNPAYVKGAIYCAFQLTEALQLTYRLLDNQGRVLYLQPVRELEAGNHRLVLEKPEGLAPGDYYMQLLSNGRQKTMKVSFF